MASGASGGNGRRRGTSTRRGHPWGLILRGVAAMLEEEETDASREALREWLPPLEELRRIANLQDAYRAHGYNMVHPALLCARLHGERLGDWAPSVELATLLVELEPFNPPARRR